VGSVSAWNALGLPPRLTAREWDALRQWKAKYEVEGYLERQGFTLPEAKRLMFLRWRFPNRRAQ
jgi:hypothetical protein